MDKAQGRAQVPPATHAARHRQRTSDLDAALDRIMTSTAEQREQWRREAADKRAAEREQSAVAFTPEVVERRMGWKPGYLAHLAQPYCDCGDNPHGWEYCSHAY